MNNSVEYNYFEGRLTHLCCLLVDKEKEPLRAVGPAGRLELEQRRASFTTLH